MNPLAILIDVILPLTLIGVKIIRTSMNLAQYPLFFLDFELLRTFH